MNDADPTTSDRVLAALARTPGSTASEVAEALGAGRSTVSKALAGLAREGRVIREAGGDGPGGRSADRWSLPPERDRVDQGSGPPVRGRLVRGELRAAVADYLAAHPDQDWSPTAVARTLGRSAGAVANALARLVEAGVVTEISSSPHRYRHGPP